MAPLKDYGFQVYLIGCTQILNIVVEASLEAQHSSYFATSSLHLVTEAIKKIEKLSDNWEWEEENLVFAGVGSPSKLIANLKDGIFKPFVTE